MCPAEKSIVDWNMLSVFMAVLEWLWQALMILMIRLYACACLMAAWFIMRKMNERGINDRGQKRRGDGWLLGSWGWECACMFGMKRDRAWKTMNSIKRLVGFVWERKAETDLGTGVRFLIHSVGDFPGERTRVVFQDFFSKFVNGRVLWPKVLFRGS